MAGASDGEEDSEWSCRLCGRRVVVSVGDVLLGGLCREPVSGRDCWGNTDHVDT